MANSGVYFIDNINKANNGETTCSCYISSEKGFGGFSLSKDGMVINNPIT